MISKAQVRCKVIRTALLYQTFVCFWQFIMIFGHKMGEIIIVPSFQLKLDDVTVTLSLIVLSSNFFGDVSWYDLTPNQTLLRLNVIFMVRKMGQFLLNWGGGGAPPALSLCLILGPRW